MKYGRTARILTVGLLAVPAIAMVATWAYVARMPGTSFDGALPPLTDAEMRVRDDAKRDVEMLATTIGERNHQKPEALAKSAQYIGDQLTAAGYEVHRQPFEAVGMTFENLEAVLSGTSDEVVVIGAHYDAAEDCPAANDNGTGVAALLALARMFASSPQTKTLRFVAFANEEPPHFQKAAMGSLHYANKCGEAGDRITAMLSLETMGYYRDDEGSQEYPFPFSLFYPSTGNFIGFVGDTSSRALVHETIDSFRRHARFPSQGAAMPAAVPGAGWSDHWSFWQNGYPAVMVTDTAPFRYPHYHTPEDTPDKVDYPRLARVIAGLEKVIVDLAR